jgi:hypothetical protein
LEEAEAIIAEAVAETDPPPLPKRRTRQSSLFDA